MPVNLLKDLNPTQLKAVQETQGPILILAGAGSGKTRVLTYKAAYLLLELKINPLAVLCVTFTNKAANEMKERVARLLGSLVTRSDPNTQQPSDPATQTPAMGTFHAICAKMLRIDGEAIGIPRGFVIYDTNDQKDLVKQCLADLNLPVSKISPNAVLHTISGAKSELIGHLEYPQYARGYFQENCARVYLRYQKYLEENGALDFDDLLMRTVELFTKAPHILEKYQQRYRYILVDEYQDTNHAQYIITKQLAKRWRNICVVGDASQSIYSFRGADFRNIVNFQKDYPDAKIFNLEENYRSTQNILDSAYAVISKNTTHPILKLVTNRDTGEKVYLYEARDEMQEAKFIINEIHRLIKSNKNYDLNNFAVLYRTNAQSRTIEEAFLEAGIPYTLVGGIRFYERKEIKDVLSYLRLIANPLDLVSLNRAVKIGKKRLADFEAAAKELRSQKLPTLEVLDLVLKATNYLTYLDDGTDEGATRIENVKELRSVAQEFPNIDDFLENVALVEQDTYAADGRKMKNRQDTEAVTLMTLHAAKGLEFSVVFMVGLEEGLFPHARSLLEPMELEEERRLCYVGITRAKDLLYLTYTQNRLIFGSRANAMISRFVLDIPQELMQFTSL